jgi:hypothetical protein
MTAPGFAADGYAGARRREGRMLNIEYRILNVEVQRRRAPDSLVFLHFRIQHSTFSIQYYLFPPLPHPRGEGPGDRP